MNNVMHIRAKDNTKKEKMIPYFHCGPGLDPIYFKWVFLLLLRFFKAVLSANYTTDICYSISAESDVFDMSEIDAVFLTRISDAACTSAPKFCLLYRYESFFLEKA